MPIPSNPLVRAANIISVLYVLILLLCIGFLCNMLQFAISLCVFLPATTRLNYRRQCSTFIWYGVSILMEIWGNVPYRYTGDVVGRDDNCVLIGNHGPGLDFTSGVSLTNEFFGTGRVMTMLKDSLKYYPVLGWTHFFQGSLFLKRHWEKDKERIAARMAKIDRGQWPTPYCIGIYPEGTRITPKKRQESQEYAKERGLPLLNNVLLPRTKGFLHICKHIPKSVDCVYDFTIGYGPSIGSKASSKGASDGVFVTDMLLKGGFTCPGVHIHVRRIPFSTLPKAPEALTEWIMNNFQQKDNLLQHMIDNGRFPGEQMTGEDNQFGNKMALVFLVWSVLLNISAQSFNFVSDTTSWIMWVLPVYVLIRHYVYGIGNLSGRKAKQA